MYSSCSKMYPKNGQPPEQLQNDLHKLDTWSETWLLRFHPSKCHQLVINRSRDDGRTVQRSLPSTNIGQGHIALECVTAEKDLGITIDNKLSFVTHIDSICSKARQIMGLIRRTIDNLSPEIFKPLFVALVRSHLEYGQAVWSPHTKRDIDKLESVQRTATKQVNGLRNMSYPDRLRRLKLPTLKYRRCRGDMIEVYKIVHKIYDPVCAPNLPRTGREGRSHNLRLFKQQVQNLDIRKYSFSIRVVDVWNNLPAPVVNAPSLNAFKNRLDKHWETIDFRFNTN